MLPHDVASILVALTTSTVTMAIALPAVMGQVSRPARFAQAGVALQAMGWVLLMLSGRTGGGHAADWALSTLAMAGISTGFAFNAAAFELWRGRATPSRASAVIAVVLPVGYGLAFPNYMVRFAWANGLFSVQLALAAIALGRPAALPVGRWRWLLVVALVAQLVVTTWRGLLGAFFSDSLPNFLTPHPVNVTFALVANATTVLSMVGMLLAHRDEAARELLRLATFDGLTDVLNRRAWLLRAHTELAMSVRYGHPLAVLMIDIDHFKRVNDAHGHEAGDRALRFVARALQTAIRTGDIVGRYGGEEFCVLMNHADHESATAFDRRMRERLAKAAMGELGFELSYSAGIALRESPEDTLEAMLRRADAMLYRAKDGGRSRTLDSRGVRLEAV